MEASIGLFLTNSPHLSKDSKAIPLICETVSSEGWTCIARQRSLNSAECYQPPDGESRDSDLKGHRISEWLITGAEFTL